MGKRKRTNGSKSVTCTVAMPAQTSASDSSLSRTANNVRLEKIMYAAWAADDASARDAPSMGAAPFVDVANPPTAAALAVGGWAFIEPESDGSSRPMKDPAIAKKTAQVLPAVKPSPTAEAPCRQS
eukprot:1804881-Rhodomonas_salina.3